MVINFNGKVVGHVKDKVIEDIEGMLDNVIQVLFKGSNNQVFKVKIWEEEHKGEVKFNPGLQVFFSTYGDKLISDYAYLVEGVASYDEMAINIAPDMIGISKGFRSMEMWLGINPKGIMNITASRDKQIGEYTSMSIIAKVK